MKQNFRVSALLALVVSCAWSQEQDSLQVNPLQEVVISDTKFAIKKQNSGKVIEVITSADLEKKSGQTLATILSQVTGVEINGNQSANGKNLGYYIRGGKNRQVLILIDGIPVTDASGISMEYDLRLLPIEQVERIEVMKGAASTLYGTGAATGVINITLKKNAEKTIQGNAYLNIGSNNTSENSKYNGQDFNQGIAVSGKVNKVTYYAGFNSAESDGMSQIASPEDVTYEADRFSRQNALAKLGWKLSKKIAVDFFGNYDKISNEYDFTFDGSGSNDTNLNTTTSEQFRFGWSPKYTYQKGELVLNSGFTRLKRDYNEFNSFSSTIDYSQYESRSIQSDLYNKWAIRKDIALITGINYQFHDMMTETPFGNIFKETTKFNILDGYATVVYNSDFGLNINAGGRWNHHSQYGNDVVYNFNPSYNFKTTFPLKLLASYSTAFVTPSLYQLYSEYGNGDLTPEKNATAEIGFETSFFGKRVTLNAVGFYRDQKDAIDFFFNPETFEAFYININGKTKAKGIETALQLKLSEKFSSNFNYTFTQVDSELDRLIPRHKANASFDYQPTKRTLFNLSYQYFDSRKDAFYNAATFTVDTVKLSSYQLLNALIKHELIVNRLSVFGTVTNIFNEDFIENIGYSTRGRNFRLGVNIIL